MNLSGNVTRAQFVKMMTAASTYRDSVGAGYGYSLFKDVKSDHWASEYIKLAVEQGWITGYVDGTFRPNNTVTLEEACTALLRMLGYDSSSLAGTFPTAQLSKASAVGLLDGMTATRGQKLTRSDCVSLFNNLLTAETSEMIPNAFSTIILSLFNQNNGIKSITSEKFSYICSELVDILSELTF